MLLSAALVALIAWFGFPQLQRLEAQRRAERAYGRLLACLCGPELDCREPTLRARWRALASVRADRRQWPRQCAAPAAELVAALRLQQQAGGCETERCEALRTQAAAVREALDPADELHPLPLGSLMDTAKEAGLQLTAQDTPLIVPRPHALLRSDPAAALSGPLDRPPQIRTSPSGWSLLMVGPHEAQLCRLRPDQPAAHCRRHALPPAGHALLDESGRCLVLHDPSAGKLRLLSEAGTAEAAVPYARLNAALCSGETLWVHGTRVEGATTRGTPAEGTAAESAAAEGASATAEKRHELARVLPEPGEPLPVRGALPQLSAHGILMPRQQGGIELRAANGEQLWALPLTPKLDRLHACPTARTLVLSGSSSGHTTAIATVGMTDSTPAVASTTISSARFSVSCHKRGATISWVDGANEQRLAPARNPNGRAIRGRYLAKQQTCTQQRCEPSEQLFALNRLSASSHHLIAPLGEGQLALWLSPLGDVRSLLQRPGAPSLPWPLLAHEGDGGFVWDGAMVQLHSDGERALLLLTDQERRLHALLLSIEQDAGTYHIHPQHLYPTP